MKASILSESSGISNLKVLIIVLIMIGPVFSEFIDNRENDDDLEEAKINNIDGGIGTSGYGSNDPVGFDVDPPVELTVDDPVELTTPDPIELTTPDPVRLTTPEPIELTTPDPVEMKQNTTIHYTDIFNCLQTLKQTSIEINK